jgi:hypothetical protein
MGARVIRAAGAALAAAGYAITAAARPRQLGADTPRRTRPAPPQQPFQPVMPEPRTRPHPSDSEVGSTGHPFAAALPCRPIHDRRARLLHSVIRRNTPPRGASTSCGLCSETTPATNPDHHTPLDNLTETHSDTSPLSGRRRKVTASQQCSPF